MSLPRSQHMSKHVLVPVDGSEESWSAFSYALEEHLEDTLTVLHIVDPMKGDYDTDEQGVGAVKRSEAIEREVFERVAESGHDSDRVAYVTREGRPVDEILAHAAGDEIDQIVMGSRGLSGVERLLLGSVAESVVRRADVPVNIVR